MNRHYALGRLKQGVMNKTEAVYAQRLDLLQKAGEILWHRFESIKFRLADNTFYTPDFAVLRADGVMEIHEVKGSMAIFQDDAKVKVKVCAEAFPFRFLVAVPRKKNQGGGWDITEY